jgi:uncharacterized OB-fold protein
MSDATTADDGILRAPLVIEYPFKRTVGPVQSAFLTGLREGILVGVRRPNGTVLCPPVEYDPETADELDQLVQLSDEGTVTTWAWIGEPRPNQPLDHAFAWALVQIDGADSGFLHAVDAGTEAAMSTGMRVRARFRPADQREGMITDIECFEPIPSNDTEASA